MDPHRSRANFDEEEPFLPVEPQPWRTKLTARHVALGLAAVLGLVLVVSCVAPSKASLLATSITTRPFVRSLPVRTPKSLKHTAATAPRSPVGELLRRNSNVQVRADAGKDSVYSTVPQAAIHASAGVPDTIQPRESVTAPVQAHTSDLSTWLVNLLAVFGLGSLATLLVSYTRPKSRWAMAAHFGEEYQVDVPHKKEPNRIQRYAMMANGVTQMLIDAGLTGAREVKALAIADGNASEVHSEFPSSDITSRESIVTPSIEEGSVHEQPEPKQTPTPDKKPKGSFMKQTHIVCTLGPSTHDLNEIKQLLKAGMSVARFNLSHGDYEYHLETLRNLRKACAQTGLMCATLLDTKGPEIRTGYNEEGAPITFTRGSEVKVTTDYSVKCNPNVIALSYPKLPSVVHVGDVILVADGTLMLKVKSVSVEDGYVETECLNNATIGERKNCNLPGVLVDLPILSAKDEEDLRFAIANDFDFIAVSFVRNATDIRIVRHVMREEGSFIRIISKIENQEGLGNLDQIIEESDGVMVARGDLGMEIPLEQMFQVQKVMIKKCNFAGKPVVTATQMLESMCNNPLPTRAEATDVANAVIDGTDCVMLSGETAAGKFPVESVNMMRAICTEAEKCINNYEVAAEMERKTMRGATMSVHESLASSAVQTASKVGAQLIVCLAATGDTARLVSKYRPSVPVVVGVVSKRAGSKIGYSQYDGYTPEKVARQLLLTRGLIPTVITHDNNRHPEENDQPVNPAAAAADCVEEALDYAKMKGLVKKGDLVVTMHNVDKQCAAIRVITCP